MQVKFYKSAVQPILAGLKTLEPRPRSGAWVERLLEAGVFELTFGPRFGAPTVFGSAKLVSVEIKPFAAATQADLARVGPSWVGGDPAVFALKYEEWFARDLARGYDVAWLDFRLIVS